MKNGRQRKHHSRRDKTPSVICLPPPKPPVTAPRHEPEVIRALSFPALEEPLVTKKKRNAPAPGAESRQVRRKAKRAEMKGRSRAALPVTATDQTAISETPSETLAPLPKSKALALTRPGMLQQVGSWLRGLVMVKRPATGTHLANISVSQINTLRRQVETMQKTLDKMLESSRA